MPKTPELGDIVDIFCERCRLNLDASVAAVLDGEIRKVQCRTCGNFVPYRPPVPDSVRKDRAIKRVLAMRDRKMSRSAPARAGRQPSPPAPASTPATGKKRPLNDPRWLELTENVTSTAAAPYRQDRVYGEGDYILHKSFGMGYVERTEGEDEMVVLFRGGEQTLPMNQPPE